MKQGIKELLEEYESPRLPLRGGGSKKKGKGGKKRGGKVQDEG